MEKEHNAIEQKAMEVISSTIKLIENLPGGCTVEIMGRALIRSSATAGVHYADACKARSSREFLRDMKLMSTQLRQVDFWLKMIESSGYFTQDKLNVLKDANSDLMNIVSVKIRKAQMDQKALADACKTARDKALLKFP